ncbi:MAG: hypothetical protein COZ31_02120 [Nitrospirae bacterium CG_4_10_14_3_um_filter_44_29]|nr:MAG: hypothetical protein AUJ60_06610 [Nitrospirae bacterium CG1_02_44_142]PIP71307.1 MAG: hypothetical protein COW90_00775 [Nitrospirae bacterium CG22_combo_CG10-13_8_21_14_all_44_11]PIV41257.1 MAG: hypothetical protein COS28_05595 [Nitrospirae bacterium CG02_land_8_20_14_3_00_44_33]PIV65682.1 MAG: hypothetical protein COS10_10060 [Nitrospirae bacterium CG01_land_8_20_14_3_00_44_22]PIW90819.1 MAG: hypothetical protein COZ93_00060 [Nitrospirae bacterium CG_4_8_14_3_um_filter_44_28]PIX89417.
MGLSEIIPSAPKIDRIISRIEEGDIKIPDFQRGFVWNQEQVINLGTVKGTGCLNLSPIVKKKIRNNQCISGIFKL